MRMILILTLALASCVQMQDSKDEPVENSQTKTIKEKPKEAPKLPMVVLTYNICWECMTNSSKGSAGRLGQQCSFLPSTQNPTTLCAANMGALLEKSVGNNSYGALDFVALQEATLWQSLVDRAPQALGSLKALPTKKGINEMVTFYNDKKYTLIHRIEGGFEVNDRPYQILIFKEKLLFVNLHNCHGHCTDPSFVDQKLSQSLTDNLTRPEIRALHNYRMIVSGDFNDHKPAGKLRSFAPFRTAGIPTMVNTASAPATCCDTRVPWKGTMAGDYILDSEAPIKTEVPEDYDYSKPQSDHLPVISVLKPL